jgi:hypothetical protein
VCLQDVPKRLGLLEGLRHLAPRLPAAQAAALATALEQGAGPHQPEETDSDWDPFFRLRNALSGRAAKVDPLHLGRKGGTPPPPVDGFRAHAF